jgi:hypothetical protein
MPRPETGPMQADSDWPGVFLRGDNALYFARTIEAALTLIEDKTETMIVRTVLTELQSTLESCDVYSKKFDAKAITKIARASQSDTNISDR